MGAKICVCLKVVPRAEVQLRIEEATHRLDRSGASELNPADEYAIEEALSIAASLDAEVVAVSMVPLSGVETLRHALALGVDRVVAISDVSLAGADMVVTSRVLAKFLEREAPDVIVLGSQAMDGRGAMLGGAIGQHMDLPVMSGVRSARVEGGRLRATRLSADGEVVLETTMPCVVALSGSANVPRYPSFRDIVTSKRKDISVISAADLGLVPSESGPAGSRTHVIGIAPRPVRQADAEIFVGEDGAAAFLVGVLDRAGLT